MGTVASTPDSKDARVPLVSHTTARPRQDDTSFVSQTIIGRHSESDPAGASRRYENPAAPTNETIRHDGAVQGWTCADASATTTREPLQIDLAMVVDRTCSVARRTLKACPRVSRGQRRPFGFRDCR